MDEQKNGLKKVLGFWDLMGIGVGQIIGSGIMVLTGICISITGAGTPFAFLLAAVLVICPNPGAGCPGQRGAGHRRHVHL